MHTLDKHSDTPELALCAQYEVVSVSECFSSSTKIAAFTDADFFPVDQVEVRQLIQTPKPFDKMVTFHVLFKMTKKDYGNYLVKDSAFWTFLHRCYGNKFRLGAKMVAVQLDQDNRRSEYMIQIDLELDDLDENTCNSVLHQAEDLFEHRHYDSSWRDILGARVGGGGGGDSESKDAKCHLRPIDPQGCKCAKHVKAWQDRVALIKCHICQTRVQPKQEASL